MKKLIATSILAIIVLLALNSFASASNPPKIYGDTKISADEISFEFSVGKKFGQERYIKKRFPIDEIWITAIGKVQNDFQLISIGNKNEHYAYGEKFLLYFTQMDMLKKKNIAVYQVRQKPLCELLKEQKTTGSTPKLQKEFDNLMIESLAYLEKDVRTFTAAIKIAALTLEIYRFCSPPVQKLAMEVTEISFIGAKREFADIRRYGNLGSAKEFLKILEKKKMFLPEEWETSFRKEVSDFINKYK